MARRTPFSRISVVGGILEPECNALFAAFAQDTDHDGGKRCWVFEDGWTEKSGLSWRYPGFEQDDDHPVTCVDWYDARRFAQWMESRTGKAFRLPTEAEWEYAPRAGSDTTYYWGDDPAGLCKNSNAADTRALEHYPGFAVNRCDDGFVRTSPVASFPPNPGALCDMYGNVWEWVADCWNTSDSGAPTQGSTWSAGDCSRRGFRGGGYGDIPRFARSALGNRCSAIDRKDDIGFRLVVDGRSSRARRRYRFAIFGRAGAPCPVCGTSIERSEAGARRVYRCPICQPGPGVVATAAPCMAGGGKAPA